MSPGMYISRRWHAGDLLCEHSLDSTLAHSRELGARLWTKQMPVLAIRELSQMSSLAIGRVLKRKQR